MSFGLQTTSFGLYTILASMQNPLQRFLKSLGPGILFASTCIGVSHLVQSTRAGALFSFGLLWAVIAANLFKYPFFEYASRYANSTGESIIDGYRRLGKWMLWLYLLVTAASMFFVVGAVGAVTAGFLDNLFGISQSFGPESLKYTITGLFLLCIGVLLIGHYKVLDFLIKIIGTVLLVSTIAAVIVSLAKGPALANQRWFAPEALHPSGTSFAFLIALMGWMPTALDISAWNSLWTLERIKQTGFHPKLKETLAEFNFGYIITAVLAPCFLLLGAYLLYGTGYQMPENSAGFAHGIIGLFTESFGQWSYLLIAASAFSIMFGTCIAVFDGYSRSIERIFELLAGKKRTGKAKLVSSTTRNYNLSLLLVGLGAFIVVFQFGTSLKSLVDLATTISFVIAPVIAVVNFRLVTGKYLPEKDQPKMWLRWLSYAGILFLSGFAVVYLIFI